jgi:single-strand DNA-binding protein
MAKYGLNQVTLIGSLGRDPEIKYLDQGIALANLWLACTERVRGKDGNYTDRTEWVSVNLWRSQAELVGKYCRRGSTVCIEGRLTTRSWETQQGEKRSKTEVEGSRVILLDAPPAAGAETASAPVAGYQQPATKQAPAPVQEVTSSQEEEPDDLPF